MLKIMLQYIRIFLIQTNFLYEPSTPGVSQLFMQVAQCGERPGLHQVWALNLRICPPVPFLSAECFS